MQLLACLFSVTFAEKEGKGKRRATYIGARPLCSTFATQKLEVARFVLPESELLSNLGFGYTRFRVPFAALAAASCSASKAAAARTVVLSVGAIGSVSRFRFL